MFAFPCQARESPASAAALHTVDQLARKPLAGSPVWPAYPAAETTSERHPPHALSYGLQGQSSGPAYPTLPPSGHLASPGLDSLVTVYPNI